MISSMTRFEIVGPRDLLWETLEVLQDTGLCHLEPSPLEVEGTPTRLERAELGADESAYRAKADELSGQLEKVLEKLPAEAFADRDDLAALCASLAGRSPEDLQKLAASRLAQWGRLEERLQNLHDDKSLLDRYLRILDGLAALHVHSNSVVIPLLLGTDGEERKKIVSEITALAKDGRVEHVERSLGGGTVMVALAVPAKAEDAVREYVWEHRIPEAVFPREYAELPTVRIRDKLESRRAEIPLEIADAEADVAAFVESSGSELIALGWTLSDTAARFHASQKAALSRFAFQLTGWIPEDGIDAVKEELAKLGDDAVEFQKVPYDHHHETPPSRLANAQVFAPAQSLLGIFPPPRYGSIDPSMVMMITFPFFFGWMVGDAGYGGVLFLLTLWARMKWGAKNPVIKDVTTVFLLAATSAMIFGVLFGEYFGHFGAWLKTGDWHGHIHLWMGRTQEYLPKYLGYSVAIGMLHMTLSLLFGIYTGIQHMEHGDEHAFNHVLEKTAMLLCLIGFFLLSVGGMVADLRFVGEKFASNPESLMTLGGLLIVAGVAVLVYALPGSQKVLAPIEGVTILSNTISYARLMAVGAAGVVIAGIANDFGRQAEGQNLLVGALIVLCAIFLHVFAFVLCIFDPLIQGLRLHYVEFFSKFYEATGVPYAPLARKGGQTS